MKRRTLLNLAAALCGLSGCGRENKIVTNNGPTFELSETIREKCSKLIAGTETEAKEFVVVEGIESPVLLTSRKFHNCVTFQLTVPAEIIGAEVEVIEEKPQPGLELELRVDRHHPQNDLQAESTLHFHSVTVDGRNIAPAGGGFVDHPKGRRVHFSRESAPESGYQQSLFQIINHIEDAPEEVILSD